MLSSNLQTLISNFKQEICYESNARCTAITLGYTFCTSTLMNKLQRKKCPLHRKRSVIKNQVMSTKYMKQLYLIAKQKYINEIGESNDLFELVCDSDNVFNSLRFEQFKLDISEDQIIQKCYEIVKWIWIQFQDYKKDHNIYVNNLK